MQMKEIYDIDWENIAKSLIMGVSMTPEIGEFRWKHTQRVYMFATQLSRNMNLDGLKIKVMCYLHDAFKYVSPHNHGKVAADMLKHCYITPWLESTYEIGSRLYKKEEKAWRLVFDAMTRHSAKTKNSKSIEKNPYLSILMDADMIDKMHPEWIEGVHNLFDERNRTFKQVAVDELQKVVLYFWKSPRFLLLRSSILENLQIYAWKYHDTDLSGIKIYGRAHTEMLTIPALKIHEIDPFAQMMNPPVYDDDEEDDEEYVSHFEQWLAAVNSGKISPSAIVMNNYKTYADYVDAEDD